MNEEMQPKLLFGSCKGLKCNEINILHFKNGTTWVV